MNITISIRENLKRLLASRGKTQRELEKIMGAPEHNNISRKMRNGTWKIEELVALADYFGVSLDELVGRERPAAPLSEYGVINTLYKLFSCGVLSIVKMKNLNKVLLARTREGQERLAGKYDYEARLGIHDERINGFLLELNEYVLNHDFDVNDTESIKDLDKWFHQTSANYSKNTAGYYPEMDSMSHVGYMSHNEKIQAHKDNAGNLWWGV